MPNDGKMTIMTKLIQKLPIKEQDKNRLESLLKEDDVRLFPVKFTQHQIELLKIASELGNVFLPSEKEIGSFGETENNYGEKENTILQGLQHKYPSTVLLTVWNECVANCRYCFRRYTARQDNNILQPKDYDLAVNYINAHPEVSNVLFSGGDPLAMPRKKLEELLQKISSIQNMKFIRIGSKVLADNPEMINEELTEMLGKYSRPNKRMYIVNHFNHPAEVNQKTALAADRLTRNGIKLLNQHPIIAEVNDNEDAIVHLYKELAAIGITPYYTFHLMPVKGAMHLQTAIDETFYMLERAKLKLAGPEKTFRYVIPGRTGKYEVLGFDNKADDKKKPTRIYLKAHESKDSRTEMQTMTYRAGQKWIDI